MGAMCAFGALYYQLMIIGNFGEAFPSLLPGWSDDKVAERMWLLGCFALIVFMASSIGIGFMAGSPIGCDAVFGNISDHGMQLISIAIFSQEYLFGIILVAITFRDNYVVMLMEFRSKIGNESTAESSFVNLARASHVRPFSLTHMLRRMCCGGTDDSLLNSVIGDEA